MDRKRFFNYVRSRTAGLFPGRLSRKQVAGMEAILDAFALYGDGEDKSLAYILATARHEVGMAMHPVRETFATSDVQARTRLSKRKYAKPINGKSYYGRGFVQLTHLSNYQKFSRLLGVDLVGNPDLALEKKVSARILVEGLIHGYFNGSSKGIGYYLSPTRNDLKNARRTVNITDKWQRVARFYKAFLGAIQYSKARAPKLVSNADIKAAPCLPMAAENSSSPQIDLDQKNLPLNLEVLESRLKQIALSLETITDAQPIPDPSLKTKSPDVLFSHLTPVNSALGKTLGNAMNGRKTALGMFGLLGTSLIPILFPDRGTAYMQLADFGAEFGKGDPAKGQQLLTILYLALTAWGVLGKVEKWMLMAALTAKHSNSKTLAPHEPSA